MALSLLGYVLISSNIFLFLVLIFLKWKDILCSIFPQWFSEVTMVELDNNVRTWLQWRGKDLRFKFNNGIYNLFYTADNNQAFRSGNLQKFFYFEGYVDPVNIKKPDYQASTKIRNEMLKLDFSKIINRDNGIMDALKGISPIIIIGGFLIIIYMISQIGKGG